MAEWLDWQPDGALVSEGMQGACRQKLVGCLAGTVGEMEPDALPAEETGAKLGGRCAPGFSHDTSKQAQGDSLISIEWTLGRGSRPRC